MKSTIEEGVFVYVSVYRSPEDARADYAELRSGRRQATDGRGFDAALVYRDADGEVKVRKRERATGKGMRTGAGVGAVLGVVLPPTIPLSVAMNTTARGAVSYLRRGMSRSDVADLGAALSEGQAALVVLSDRNLERYVAENSRRAIRQVSREIRVAAEDLVEKLAES